VSSTASRLAEGVQALEVVGIKAVRQTPGDQPPRRPRRWTPMSSNRSSGQGDVLVVRQAEELDRLVGHRAYRRLDPAHLAPGDRRPKGQLRQGSLEDQRRVRGVAALVWSGVPALRKASAVASLIMWRW